MNRNPSKEINCIWFICVNSPQLLSFFLFHFSCSVFVEKTRLSYKVFYILDFDDWILWWCLTCLSTLEFTLTWYLDLEAWSDSDSISEQEYFLGIIYFLQYSHISRLSLWRIIIMNDYCLEPLIYYESREQYSHLILPSSCTSRILP